MKRSTQKWLSILLSMAMVMSMLPTAAFATEDASDDTLAGNDNYIVGDDTAVVTPVCTCNTMCWDASDAGDCPVCSVGDGWLFDCLGEDTSVQEYGVMLLSTGTALTQDDFDSSSSGYTLAAGTYYLSEDIDLSYGLTFTGDATLYLNDYVLKYAPSSSYSYASVITVNSGVTLELYDDYTDDGASQTTRYWTVDSDGLWSLAESQDTPTSYTTTGGCITGGTGTYTYTIDFDGMLNEYYYGGGIYVSGTLNLHSGNIVGNTVDGWSNSSFGGGVYVTSSGDFTMDGGIIVGNYADISGGGVYNSNITTLKDGSITGNTANLYGGGVYNIGTFTMEDGSITGNAAYYGGGVDNARTFTMEAGSITDNSADSYGGGMYNTSTFVMKDGSITGNTAVNSGGGVYNSGTIEVSGSPEISGNTMGEAANNVYLYYYSYYATLKYITITGDLDESAQIGVTTGSTISDASYATITSGASTYTTSTANFTSDGEYYVTMANGEVCLFTSEASSTWTGRASSASATTDYEVDSDGDYTIKTALGLAYFANLVNGSGTTINATLAGDINLLGLAWTPIGTYENSFQGTFDGAGYEVSGLYINETASVTDYFSGLFGYIEGGGILCNLGVSGEIITTGSAGQIVGGVAGGVQDGAVYNCYADVDISVTGGTFNYVGGVVGQLSGGDAASGGYTVANCYATGSVSAMDGSADNISGGVVGKNYGTVSDCYWYVAEIDTGIGSDAGTASNVVGFSSASALTGTLSDGTTTYTTLLSALDAWVDTEASTEYCTWVAGTGDYPLFGDYYTSIIFPEGIDGDWAELTSGTDVSNITDNVNFYLADGVELTGTLTIPSRVVVNLYLNGQTLDGTIVNEGTLNICDVEDNSGTVTSVVTNDGTLTIEGGSYSSAVVNNDTLILSGSPSLSGGVTLAEDTVIDIASDWTANGTIAITVADTAQGGDDVVNSSVVLSVDDFSVDSGEFDLTTAAGGTELYLVAVPSELPFAGNWMPLPSADDDNYVQLEDGNFYYLHEETDFSNYTIESLDQYIYSTFIYLNGQTTTGSLTGPVGYDLSIYGDVDAETGATTTFGAELYLNSNVYLVDCSVTEWLELNDNCQLYLDNVTVGDVHVAQDATIDNLTVAEGYTLIVAVGKVLTVTDGLINNGTVYIMEECILDIDGTMTNNGTVENEGTLDIYDTMTNNGLVTNGDEASYDTTKVTNSDTGLFIGNALPDGVDNEDIFTDYDEDMWFNGDKDSDGVANTTATFTGNTDWTVSKAVAGTAAEDSIYTDSVSFTTQGEGVTADVYVKNNSFVYPTTVTYSLDLTMPIATITTATNTSWQSSDITVSVSVSDTYLYSWEYTLDGGASWTAATSISETSFTISTDGDYTDKVQIRATDEAGNVTTSSAITVKLDTVEPTISVEAQVDGESYDWGWTAEDVVFTLTTADGTSDVNTVTVTREKQGDETEDVAYTVTDNSFFAADQNGTYTITVTDNAGNESTETVTLTQIDQIAPVVTLHTVSEANWYGDSMLIQRITEDNLDSIIVTGDSLTADGVDITDSKQYATAETVAGTYTYTVTATDLAGNQTAETVTLNLDPVIDESIGYLGDSYTKDEAIAANQWYSSLTALQQYHLTLGSYTADQVEAMNEKLAEIAQDMADDVSEAIYDAGTIDEITAAKAAYDALTDDAKALISDVDVETLTEKVANAAYASAAQTLLDVAETGTYEQKINAISGYESYMDSYGDTLDLIGTSYDTKYCSVTEDVEDASALIAAIKAVSAPYDSTDREAIEAIRDSYENDLTNGEQTLFSNTSYKASYDALIAALEAVEYAETLIDGLTSDSSDDAIKAAKAAFDGLSSDSSGIISATSVTTLSTAYSALIATQDGDTQAVTAFEVAVMEATANPTVVKIQALETTYAAFTADQQSSVDGAVAADYSVLLTDLVAALPVIELFDAIDVTKLTSDSVSQVSAALVAYDSLDADQQNLVVEATGDKVAILAEAQRTYNIAAAAIAELSGIGSNYSEANIKLIEDAKIAYEKLTDAGRLMISGEQKAILDAAYDGLMSYLDYVNTATTNSTTVEVVGLSDKVDTQQDASVNKVVVSVQATDSNPIIVPTPTDDAKDKLLSVDVKLLAEYYILIGDGEGQTEDLIGSSYVQPKASESILLKMELPTGYELGTLELWHVKDDGTGALIADYTVITENGKNYIVFETDSLSHFVFFAEAVSSSGSGDSGNSGSSGGGSSSSSYSSAVATATNGTVSLSTSAATSNTTVTITATPDEGYAVGSVTVTSDSGDVVVVTDNGDGTYSYDQPSSSVTITVTFVEAEAVEDDSFFTDVDGDDWFYDAVLWAVGEGITTGKATTSFAPYDINTRAEAVTFLYRAAGSLQVSGDIAFDDVDGDAYYADPVLWATQQGITQGTSNTTFSPAVECTRAQIITFLWRMMGEPEVAGDCDFVDVDADVYYADAVLWAVQNGITQGTSDTTFSPNQPCTRGEIVTFLYRTLAD